MLTEHKEGHNALAELLIEREVIFAEDVEKIFGKRPWTSRAQEIIDSNAEEAEKYAKAVAEARAARDNAEASDAQEQQNETDKNEQ